MQNILVTGGTGTLGRLVIARLQGKGHTIRVLSRQPHESANGVEYMLGDLATGEGVEAAVTGADIIIHCAGSNKGDEDKARNLVKAASHSQAKHLVYISVVGADLGMFSYFKQKLAGEQLVAGCGIPWTTLRATQFHELLLMMSQFMVKLPILPVPTGFKFQPVSASEVADRLVELSLGAPSGLVPDIAGPKIYTMAEIIRAYLGATNTHRLLLPIWMPGKAGRSFRAGANLAPDRAVGHQSWEEFLAERVTAPGNSKASLA